MPGVYLHSSDPTVKLIAQKTFPDYNGRNYEAIIADTIRFTGTMWDEGYRNTYRLVRLADMEVLDVAKAPFLQQSALHEATHTIPEGFIVVCFHQGRKDGIRIHGPAANIAGLLPAPVDITEDEKTVLVYTRCRKSTYAGISNYRFVEARRSKGITAERWEAAKATLIVKGFLAKNGAITVDGKNLVGNEHI